MNLDLRLPVGLMFTVFGVILALVGTLGKAEYVQHSLGVNINLWWGVVMLVFGLVMLGLALTAKK